MHNLPEEVLSQIIQRLDPISLVSLSHVNRHFYLLIQPTAERFLEYLFALECQGAYGGPELRFCARTNVQTPLWDESAVGEMRWACSHCRRLLNHWHFNNHHLLQLPYRKPAYQSPAAAPVTTWKPTCREGDKFWKASRETLNKQHCDLTRLRQQHHVAVARMVRSWRRTLTSQEEWNLLKDAGLEAYFSQPSTEMSKEGFYQVLDSVITSLEGEICGYNRRQRRCNECRYQLGQLWVQSLALCNERNHRGLNLGTDKVPILRGRHLFIESAFQRYFPGLFTDMPSYTAPLVNQHRKSSLYRASQNKCHFLIMYMIRCPSCNTWKEMAFFGIGNVFTAWSPVRARRGWGSGWFYPENWDGKELTGKAIDDLICNKCFYLQYGREASDSRIQKWCRKLLLQEFTDTESRLRWGWEGFKERLDSQNTRQYVNYGYMVKDEYRNIVQKEILSAPSWKPDEETLREIKQKLELLKSNWDTWCVHSDDDALPLFFERYEAKVAEFRWLRDALDEIHNQPEMLREWVLGQASERGYA